MSIQAGSLFQTSIGGTGQTSLTQSFTVSSGNSIAVMCGGPSGTTFTVASTLSGSFGLPKVALTTVGGGEIGVWVLDGITGGSDTITVVPNGGTSTAFIGMAAVEIQSTSGFDIAHAVNVLTSGTTSTSGTVTPSQQPGLILGLMYNDTQNNSGGVDTGNGFAALTGSGVTAGHFWNFGGGSTFAWAESLRYTSTAAIAATFVSITGGSTTGTTALLFKETVAGPTATIAWTT